MADGQNTDDASTPDGAADTPTPPADSKPADAGSWDGDFDADRAKRLVENLRAEKKKAQDELTEARKRLGEKEDAEKSELQRIQERAERAERELSETRQSLLVATVAKKHGVPESLLSGSTEEEIEAKAVALAEWAGSTKKPADDVPGRPRPRLAPGNGSDAEPVEEDVAEIVKKIRGSRY